MPVVDPPQAERRLQTGYYLTNFESLLAEVERRYGDLLRPPEWDWLAAFRALGGDARRLYVRLLTRRGSWFRFDRLSYPEIELSAAVDDLIAHGFAVDAPADALTERLGNLRVDELRELVDASAPAKARRGHRRADLLSAAQVFASDPAVSAGLAARVRLVQLQRTEAPRVFRLLFFGNLSQDWTELVLRDLGVLRFEAYALDSAERTFGDRAVLDQHLELRTRRDQVEGALRSARASDLEALAQAVAVATDVAQKSWHASARRRADGVVLTVAQAVERGGDSARALALYAAAAAPPARERRVRLLARRGGLAAAAALCHEIATAPRDESETVFAALYGPRLSARRAGVRLPTRRALAVPERELVAGPPGPAEPAALAALERQGYRGFFAENWLWRALFGLAFWDVIFAAVPGAFAHPFQYGPLDLYDAFRAARSGLVEARLEALAATVGLVGLIEVWDEKFGTANRLVPWSHALRPHLELALGALRGRQLAAVCDRLSRDLGRYGIGFPDLFLIHPDHEGPLLAEIKAPGDSLRPEQRGWLEYFAERGIATTVLHLRWETK